MDTELLVDELIDGGQLLIEELRQQNFDVTAAFWVKTSIEQTWFMYIASEVVDTEGLAAAYTRLYSVLRSIPSAWTLQFDVKLIGKANPITAEVLSIRSIWPGPMPTRYGGRQLGSMIIEEAYLYPI